MFKYETVIGLEVHVELNTKTKMFCRCSADYFGKEPNTQTCPVCLGLPGGLPYINEQAIEKCIQIGLALNCSINKTSYFERKNYFYPDLAKGFQTSQLVLPVAVKGEIDVEGDDGKVIKVRINRVHQEEDTGKLTHQNGETLIDFNRSSVPLVEIVTEPDFTDSSQIRDYAKKLQQIFRYLGVSNADMERGDMRLEANVSVRPVGQKELPSYRVELKNINSFRFMVAAVEYEIRERRLVQETRGWDEDKRQTYTQRSKEEANDYRYFPEPDLPEMNLEEARVEKLKNNLPELALQKGERFVSEFGIKPADAKILTEDTGIADIFESLAKKAQERKVEVKAVANYVINHKIDLLNESLDQIIDDVAAKFVGKIEDQGELEKVAKEVISENQASADSYKAGKENAIMALVGGESKADAQKARIVLEKLLKD